MKRFVNREQERNFLETEYVRGGSSLVILYGRRRVGKTALISEFIKDKISLYFLATEESEPQNRSVFKDMVADFTGNELLKHAKVERWELIFQALLDALTDRKVVIVIDEFQYLGKSNPAFPSIFQKIWDTLLKERAIMVILCGSLISMMESQTLSYSSPLYGRRTGQIRLQQLSFRDYSPFFADKSRRELIPYYAVTGGVPKYIELFMDGSNVYEAIERNVLSKSSYLYNEPNFLLQHEVGEVGSYFSVIKTIAAGNRKLAQIASALELKQTGLTKYLRTLMNLDILQREVPITEENPEKSKRGLYRIKDHFLQFWFKFVYPHLSYIESGHPQIVMDRIRQNLVDQHVSYVYEEVCKEEMWRLNSKGQWSFHFDKLGRWWDRHTEVDLVALDHAGDNIIFGECKYWEGKVGINILASLEEKAKQVIWRNNIRKEHYIIFSISGFTPELVKLADARDDVLLCE